MIRTRVYHADNNNLPHGKSKINAQLHARKNIQGQKNISRQGRVARSSAPNQTLDRKRQRGRATHIKTHARTTSLNIPPPGDAIRIIPLGGVEEIGRNMTIVEFENEIVVVDAGIQFSTEETPGIDYILPNIKYLEERKDRVKALIITHGHLDHIGGIPYIINQIGNPPIFTREFGALLIKKRQSEFPHLPPLNIKISEKDDASIPITQKLKVRFFGLTHSIPDSTGVIIETPYGDVVFTGDVRVENNNGAVAEKETKQYEVFKNRNVLLLAMDSTGIEKPGWSISEQKVIETIDKLVKAAPARVIIATF